MACYVNLLRHTMIVALLMQFQIVVSQPQVPCYFIFGDLVVVSGNNNGLVTMAKANGRTIPDIIGKLLGFRKFIPSYASATNADISTGVNYGRVGAGIRDESGRNLGGRISLNTQLKNHAAIISRLLLLQQNSTFTKEYLNKCIYLVNMGANDYINNYWMPDNYPTSLIYTPDQYAAVLVKQFSQQLTTLYKLGARKVAVNGVGLIGYAPAETARHGTNGTFTESINNKVKLFNDRLKPLVDNINSNFRDAKFTFINITSISTPQGEVANLENGYCAYYNKWFQTCCVCFGQAWPTVNCCLMGGQCIPCDNRNMFMWFDGFRTTGVVDKVIAKRSYTAQSPTDASPYDISQLAAL